MGRPLTAVESRKIEDRISDAMRREARSDPAAWRSMTTAQQFGAAAAAAAREIVEEANLKARRVALQIDAFDRIDNYLTDQVNSGRDETRLDALTRTLAAVNDGKGNILSIESNANGIEAIAMGQLVDAFNAISPRFLGLFARRDAEEAFILEAHGIDTGNAEIKAGVKAWLDAAEALRLRFNEAGGDVGKLDNWGMPHAWSQKLAVRLGQTRFVDDFMQYVDRQKYVHEDGRLYNDAEMRQFLEEAWRTIATDGANKIKPEPMVGGAVKANRNMQHRQLHFRDGQAALAAYRTYSERNVFQALSGHVARMARDIALIEQFGPNADNAFKTFLQTTYSKASVAAPARLAQLTEKAEDATKLYNYIAGNSPPPLDNWLAKGMNDLRALLSASLLGSASITSISDNGTLYLTARVNGISGVRLFMNQLRAFNPLNAEEKNLAMRSGLMVQVMQNDMSRFSVETMGPRWSNQLSTMTHRLSGLSALTEAQRRAFSATMMDALGSMTRRLAQVQDIDPDDFRFLAAKGIDQRTWDIWRSAQPERWGGNYTVLTPESIYRATGPWTEVERHQAASRLLAVVLEEQNIAVIEPGARERAGTVASIQAGTFQGELLRSFFLFKSFPHAMMRRHVERGIKAYDGLPGKAGYLASLIALQTVFGAIAMEINDVISGRDPRNLNPLEKHGAQNLLAALLKGGALGIYGDFLLNEAGSNGRSIVETMAGPVASTIAAVDAATRANVLQFLRGEETNAGAELTRAAKGLIPGQSLWYAKAALDHMVFQELQEFFSPGYLARVKQRATREFGTTWWWAPGQDLEQARAPNIGNIVGARP